MLAPVDLEEDEAAFVVGQRRLDRGPPERTGDPRIRIEEPVLAKVLAPVLQQVVGAAGVPRRGAAIRESPQPRAQIAGEPDDEPLEFLLDPIRIDQLPKLLQLHPVRRIRVERSAALVDGYRVAAVYRRHEEQVAPVELEFEAVYLQADAGGYPAGRLQLGFAQLGVDGGRTEAGVVIVVRRRGAGLGRGAATKAQGYGGQEGAGPPGGQAHDLPRRAG